jgi:hypothetical protein
MSSFLNSDEGEAPEIVHLTDGKRSPIVIVVAVICALVVTVGVFGGYLILRKQHAKDTLGQQRAESSPAVTSAAPELEVWVDDALAKGSQTVIGGTLQNISPSRLVNLSVEVELRRRSDASTESRILKVEPQDLAANEQGRYSLSLLTHDYSGARLLKIKGGEPAAEIPFKTAQGARRPPERTPQTPAVMGKRPPRTGREEFINSPDNPVKVN